MPKKWWTAFTLLLSLGVLAACGAPGAAGTAPKSEDPRPLVLTTFTVLADMARTIGGGHVRVESITKVGAEIHGYEPTPSDLVKAQEADLILDNGLGLERWFERFLASLPAPHAVLSEGVDPVDIRSGDYEGKPNPHAWMSPLAARTYVDNTAKALGRLAPAHPADFRAIGERYKGQLDKVMEELTAAFDDPRSARALVTCEGAFSYLARDAGLAEAFLWPVNSDAEGTPHQIKDAISFVQEHRTPAVFCESTVNPSAMKQVAA
ncbi:zinc ABC transporter solute-binding protein, partial [Arthrobacter deserti]|nr:zinc ABC transporter solute-binding protein [Arthrobacter deserti]